MFIILGATGHVGSAVADALLRAGQRVTVTTRDGTRADTLRVRGADVAIVDVGNVEALRRVFRT